MARRIATIACLLTIAACATAPVVVVPPEARDSPAIPAPAASSVAPSEPPSFDDRRVVRCGVDDRARSVAAAREPAPRSRTEPPIGESIEGWLVPHEPKPKVTIGAIQSDDPAAADAVARALAGGGFATGCDAIATERDAGARTLAIALAAGSGPKTTRVDGDDEPSAYERCLLERACAVPLVAPSSAVVRVPLAVAWHDPSALVRTEVTLDGDGRADEGVKTAILSTLSAAADCVWRVPDVGAGVARVRVRFVPSAKGGPTRLVGEKVEPLDPPAPASLVACVASSLDRDVSLATPPRRVAVRVRFRWIGPPRARVSLSRDDGTPLDDDDTRSWKRAAERCATEYNASSGRARVRITLGRGRKESDPWQVVAAMGTALEPPPKPELLRCFEGALYDGPFKPSATKEEVVIVEWTRPRD